jgi:hypothetical protein
MTAVGIVLSSAIQNHVEDARREVVALGDVPSDIRR